MRALSCIYAREHMCRLRDAATLRRLSTVFFMSELKHLISLTKPTCCIAPPETGRESARARRAFPVRVRVLVCMGEASVHAPIPPLLSLSLSMYVCMYVCMYYLYIKIIENI